MDYSMDCVYFNNNKNNNKTKLIKNEKIKRSEFLPS